MLRLFVAIRPPETVRNLLTGMMGGISGARWQDDAQLHLTLRFIGEVDRHLASDIHAALGSIHHPSFTIALESCGLFDRRGRPDAVWAGVTPHEPLRLLHRKVDQALQRVGMQPESRAYLPHITLARLNRKSGRVENFLEGASGLSGAPFTVRDFSLFESRLTPEGAHYSILETYRLG